MLEQPHVSTVAVENRLPNQPFFPWLKTQTALFVSQFLGVFSFIAYLITLYYYFEGAAHQGLWEFLKSINGKIQIFVDCAHIAFVTLFIVVLFRVVDQNKEGTYRASLLYGRIFNETLTDKRLKLLVKTSRYQLRRFKRYFLYFWFAMLGLYVSFLLKHTLPLAPSGNKWPPTVHDGEALRYLLFPFLTYALNNLSMLFAFLCFIIMYLPAYNRRSNKKHYLLVRNYSLLAFFLTAAFPLLLSTVYHDGFNGPTLEKYVATFYGISGILNSVVLALLIGRLDSKLIGLPSWLVCILYFYAAVQPLFVVFDLTGDIFNAIQTIVLLVVFAFKVYFFLIIIYALQMGRLLNYLLCFPHLSLRVNSVFENQFEMKANQLGEHSFKISITKKNTDVYVMDRSLKTSTGCEERATKLRELMGRRDSYHLRELGGTHWIEVRDGNHKLCHSVSLKSEDEAWDLVEESIVKMPFCKYDHHH